MANKPTQTLRVYLAVSHELARRYLVQILETDRTLRLLFAGEIEQMQKVAGNADPCAIVVDAGTCKRPLLKIVQELRSIMPSAMVILLGPPPAGDILALLSLGIRAILTYKETEDRLLLTLHSVNDGNLCVSRTVFAEAARCSESARTTGQKLTSRQEEMRKMLGKGLANKEIAAAYRISLATVKFHLAKLYEKLAVHSRLEVVAVGGRTVEGIPSAPADPARQHHGQGP